MNQPLFSALFDETERRPLTVSELTAAVRTALEARFASVWVEGEISNFKAHSSGHWYFTIKDEAAQLRAKCFRSANTRIRFRPTDGLHVRARGRLSVYAPRGEYELVVETLDPIGAGALRIAFEQLRDRLQAEGLFAKELKRPLPVFPRRVGIVTSPTGAAIRDILNVISRRTRTVHVLVSPARVQGETAGPDIVRAIRLINQHHERALREGRNGDLVDVLIIGRGGGSSEDLWAFNQEEVARAIRKSVIPVISAVGHETDFTIADFVADVRAPTPSAAAERAVPVLADLRAELALICRRTGRATAEHVRARRHALERARARLGDPRRLLDERRQAVDDVVDRARRQLGRQLAAAHAGLRALETRLYRAHPHRRVSERRNALAALRHRLEAAPRGELARRRDAIDAARGKLEALSPLNVLERGFSLAQLADGR